MVLKKIFRFWKYVCRFNEITRNLIHKIGSI